MSHGRAEIEKPSHRRLREIIESWWKPAHNNSQHDFEMLGAYLHGASMATEDHDKELKLFYELKFLQHIAETHMRMIES